MRIPARSLGSAFRRGRCALPVTDVVPADPLLTSKTNPPAFGFTVADGIGSLDSLRCYADGQKVDMQRLGERRVELRVERPYPPGRVRVACTLPGRGRTLAMVRHPALRGPLSYRA